MAFKGAGSVLAVGDGASPAEAFTAIAEVIEITGPDQSNDEIETTNLSSTSKSFIPALKDNGTLDFEAHFDASNTEQKGLFTDAAAGTVKNYQLTWGDPSISPSPKMTFPAFVSALSNATPPNDSVKVSGTLRITGVISRNF